MINVRTSLTTASIALWFISGGCGQSVLSLYPDFPARKSAMKNFTIVADFTLVESSLGDTQRVDLTLNKSISVQMLDFIADGLNAKGFPVGNRLLGSVGVLMNRPLRVVSYGVQPVASGEDTAALPQYPPFYVAPAFARDSILLSAYSQLVRTLASLPEKKEGDPELQVQASRWIGQSTGGGAILVVACAAFSVPVTKEFRLETVTKDPVHGMVGMHEVSQLTMLWYILDTETGTIIWSDREHRLGGSVYGENIQKMASRLLDRLP